jgi:hypothetical protein
LVIFAYQEEECMMISKRYIIAARVVDQDTGQGIPGLKIEAWDKDILFDDPLGKATTQMDGSFKIQIAADTIQGLFKEKKPNLYFKVFDGKGQRIADTKEDVQRNYQQEKIPVVIRVKAPLEEVEKEDEVNKFSGRLIDKTKNMPLVGYTIQFFMLDERRLPRVWGQGTTDKDGIFTVKPSVPSKLPAESKQSLLLQIVSDEQKDRVKEREVVFVVGEANELGDIDVEIPDKKSTSPKIADLDKDLALKIPKKVQNKLAKNGIRTLLRTLVSQKMIRYCRRLTLMQSFVLLSVIRRTSKNS